MNPVIPTLLSAQAAPQPADFSAKGASRPRHAKPGAGGPGIWLPAAAVGLFLLAAAAAAVSYAAQYRLVYAARHLAVAAGLEAAIPDAAALVFACLGVALALHGRRAIRARLLNVAAAGASVLMNVIAAAPGWRDLAVWAMPPTAYALASDTLIGVVRTGAVARNQEAAGPAGEFSLLAVAGGVALWLLRLALAPVSTLSGFRAWVIEECPVAPGRRASRPVSAGTRAVTGGVAVPTASDGRPASPRQSRSVRSPGNGRPVERPGRSGTKIARFLALVAAEHGSLAAVPLGSVSRISATAAPRVGLHAGSARAALRRAVLAAQGGER